MISFGDKQYETTSIEIIDNTYKVKAKAQKKNFEVLTQEPYDVALETENVTYGFNTADYSDITMTESKGITTLVFNFVDHSNDLKAQVEELQNIIKELTEVKE